MPDRDLNNPNIFLTHSAESGLTPAAQGAIIEECKVNRFDTLKSDTSEAFSSKVLDDEKIRRFLNFTGGRVEDAKVLVDLGGMLREYGRSEKSPKDFESQKEADVVSIGIKYFEEWFYNNGPTNLPNKEKDIIDVSDYLASAAFFANQLAKIKDRETEFELKDLDKERMVSWLQEGKKFAKDVFFEITRLESEKQGKVARLSILREQLEKKFEGSRPFLKEQAKLRAEVRDKVFKESIGLMQQGIDGKSDALQKIGETFHLVLKDPAVLEEMLEKNLSFLDAWKSLSKTDVSLREFLAKSGELFEDYLKEKKGNILFAPEIKSPFEEESKLYKGYEEVLSESGIVNGKDQREQEREMLESEVVNLDLLIKNRDSLLEDVLVSADAAVSLVKKRPSGGLYMMKNYFIALKMAIDSTYEDGNRKFSIDTQRFPRQRDELVFDFVDGKRDEKSRYYKVHFKRKYLPIARIVAEQMLQKRDSLI